MTTKKTQDDAAEAANHRPVQTFSSNRVEASIWRNEHNGDVQYSVSISRAYFDKKSNTTKRTHSFSRADLDDILRVIYEASGFIAQQCPAA